MDAFHIAPDALEGLMTDEDMHVFQRKLGSRESSLTGSKHDLGIWHNPMTKLHISYGSWRFLHYISE